MLKNFFIFLAAFLSIFQASFASVTSNINDAINNTGLGRNSVISVAVKDVDSNVSLYTRRAETYLNPASSLKIFTTAAALDTLGDK